MPKMSKDSCFEDLKARILSTDLAPGLVLDEATLTARYGISRTPMREVLQRLAGEGYIHLQANRSATVSSMDITAMRTFFQTAPMIYANISRLAAENRTTRQLDQLKGAQNGFAAATGAGDASAAALTNHRFHALIGEMAQNPYLTACLDRLLIDHTRLSQTFYRPASPDEKLRILKAVEQHDALISAIEEGDGEAAVDITLQHWDLSRDRMERFVRPDPLPLDVISLKDARHAV